MNDEIGFAFLIVIPLLHNVSHLVNAAENIVWYVYYSNSSEMNEEMDMV